MARAMNFPDQPEEPTPTGSDESQNDSPSVDPRLDAKEDAAPDSPPPSTPVEFSHTPLVYLEENVGQWPLQTEPYRAHDTGRPRPNRKVLVPLVLFIATCLSTFWAGTKLWIPAYILGDGDFVRRMLTENWGKGLLYMAAVMGILLSHEMGHFLQALRYKIPASLPFFIPMPVFPIGTMGAVIALDGSRANRKEMFDMGISGPLAGLVVAIPVCILAVWNAEFVPVSESENYLNNPLFFDLLIQWIHGEKAGEIVRLTPLFMAGWVGLFVTGLNMMPISQLDGGHVTYALFGKRAHLIARTFLLGAIAVIIITNSYQWVVMLILVILIGIDHPPTSDDTVPLGPARYAIGLASLAIPIFCFMPNPLRM